jgi:hypothetical protein
VLARVLFGVPKAIDAITHEKTHGAGIVVRPYGFTAVALLSSKKRLGNLVERLGPACRNESPVFAAAPSQRAQQAILMVDTFGVAGHFATQDTCGIAVVSCGSHGFNLAGV